MIPSVDNTRNISRGQFFFIITQTTYINKLGESKQNTDHHRNQLGEILTAERHSMGLYVQMGSLTDLNKRTDWSIKGLIGRKKIIYLSAPLSQDAI